MAENETSTEKTFSNHFWGKEDAGYEALTAKMNSTKKTYEELKALYSIRASLHEDYSKKLMKHVKVGMGREETGTLRALISTAHQELETTATTHLDLAHKIRSHLELPLDNFILEQKDKRRLIQTNVEKAHRNKQLHVTHVTRASEKYEAECARNNTLETQMSVAGQREAERIKQKIERSTQDIKTLDDEYKNACLKLAETTALWNTEWKTACDRYQDMEEKRIDFIHQSITAYTNVLRGFSEKEQKSYEKFQKPLEECNAEQDIITFIQEKGTGPMIPDPPEYVNYYDDPVKTLPTYAEANFTDYKAIQATYPAATHSTPTSHASKTDTLRRTMGISSLYDPVAHITRALTKPRVRRKSATVVVAEETATQKTTDTRLGEHKPLLHSTMDSSQEEIGFKKPRPASKPEVEVEDEDELIDPRAQVVFSIGSNMFNIDHPSDNDHLSKGLDTKTDKSTTHQHNTRENNEVYDISIRDLLDQLGVSNTDTKKEAEKSTGEGLPLQKMNANEHKVENVVPTTVPDTMPTTVPTAQPDTRNTSINRIGQHEEKTMSDPAHHQKQQDGIIFWARALYDYNGTQPGDLSFLRGTWIAIVQTDHKDWWWAYTWDDRTNALSKVGGYVARAYLEIIT
ncbi:hypothetical protein BDF14DRAFT_1798612 [Spinellus fusiger]|nr:hypothetical protein BDF14DRAFT_1798612 [Spinellus fusiger]